MGGEEEMIGREQLMPLCEQAVGDLGYALVDVEVVREQNGWVLRLFVDHPFAGDGPAPDPLTRPRIGHEDCARVSRHVSALLDVEDPIVGAFRLEVSSPGLKRRLRKEADFRQFVGYQVAIKLEEPVGGRRAFTGRLAGVKDGQVTVEVDGEKVALLLRGMRKARLDQEY